MLPAMFTRVSAALRRARLWRPLILGLALTAVTGGVATATTNWTYVINFSHAPVINEGNQTGNYQIWGLGYAQLIVGSQGSNVIVGDGACPPGSVDTAYCSVAPIKGSRSAVIYGNGSGPNTIYAGYGPSLIFGGTGPNTITSAPTASLIVGGDAGDTIDADQGTTVVYAGTGANTIYALSPEGDTIYCSGRRDTVYAYRIDRIYNCARVIYQTEPGSSIEWAHHQPHYDVPPFQRNPTACQYYARFRATMNDHRRYNPW
jgi:hypothetical protein